MLKPAFHRRMRTLALLAMLLLATIPTLGRLWTAAVPHTQAIVTQLCTMAGLTSVNWVAPSTESQHTDHTSHGGTPMGDDCGYCTLAARTTVLLVCLLLPFVAAARPLPPRRQRRIPTLLRHPSGLGSRGPPALI